MSVILNHYFIRSIPSNSNSSIYCFLNMHYISSFRSDSKSDVIPDNVFDHNQRRSYLKECSDLCFNRFINFHESSWHTSSISDAEFIIFKCDLCMMTRDIRLTDQDIVRISSAYLCPFFLDQNIVSLSNIHLFYVQFSIAERGILII